jgi:low temperature requirement protein LtrA
MIVLGESVVVVALGTAGSDWDLDSASAAVLGAAAVAGIWWLYFDRQANVVLQAGTPTVVIYSYAHLPLLMGLAAMSAGLGLLIEHASDAHLGAGPSIAYLGGAVVFLLSLVATRTVTVAGARRLGISLKLGASAAILGLLATQSLIPPLALAAALVLVLVTLVALERTVAVPSEAPQA